MRKNSPVSPTGSEARVLPPGSPKDRRRSGRGRFARPERSGSAVSSHGVANRRACLYVCLRRQKTRRFGIDDRRRPSTIALYAARGRSKRVGIRQSPIAYNRAIMTTQTRSERPTAKTIPVAEFRSTGFLLRGVARETYAHCVPFE